MAAKVHANPKRAAKKKRRKVSAREDRPRPELVIITGLSGSGKASALKAFEDLGYYCVGALLWLSTCAKGPSSKNFPPS
jgi:UPF0042 nucleotide-binding protein